MMNQMRKVVRGADWTSELCVSIIRDADKVLLALDKSRPMSMSDVEQDSGLKLGDAWNTLYVLADLGFVEPVWGKNVKAGDLPSGFKLNQRGNAIARALRADDIPKE